MDEIVAKMRRERAVQFLLPLFFMSGATALVYQTLWARQLHLVFGTSTFAISTVLASFMAGLAVGGFWMARRVDSLPRPLLAYGLLEIFIGLYALGFPMLLWVIEPTYLWVGRTFAPSPLVYGLIQFAMVGTALVLPTAGMGATLPLLARFATQRLGAAGNQVGLLYSVNTAGAVCGTILAGFFLLPWFGLSATTWIAGVANLLLGLAALGVANMSAGALQSTVEEDVEEPPLPADFPLVATVAFLAGFAALIYEVAWTRVLALILGASVYAFSVMLIAFLVGIAIGGAVGGRHADRTLRLEGRRRLLMLLATLQVGVGVLGWLLLWAFSELPFWYVAVYDALNVSENPGAFVVLGLVMAGALMTPPALLMGATFPVAVRAAVGDPKKLGGPVGRIYGWNTVGSMLGAFAAGFVLLPWIGVQNSVLVGVSVNGLGALLVWWRISEGRRRFVGVAVWALTVSFIFTVARPPWNPLVMTSGMYKYADLFHDHTREGVMAFATGRTELLFYEEGLSSVVTVARNLKSGNRYLANNGKVDASSSGDMPTQVLLAMIPLQFVENPKRALVIGLASGVTVGSVNRSLSLEQIDVVELEPAIVRAAALFDDVNHRVLEDPRVNVIANDGRNQVLLSESGSYDLVISEPPNPWITGVSNLFTQEFFELGRSRLAPGGVWAQWVHLYGMDTPDLRSLLGSFADTYPYVAVYGTIEGADLVLVGSDEPLIPTREMAEDLWYSTPATQKELERVDIDQPLEMVCLFLFDRQGALDIAGDTERNTDDNMRIEYSAPWNLHKSTSDRNSAVLVQNLQVPPSFTNAYDLEELAWLYRERDDPVRALRSLVAAIQALPDNDPNQKEWRKMALEWGEQFLED